MADRTQAPDASTELDRLLDGIGNLVVASNRQPYRHEFADDGDGVEVDRPAGGLTAGIDAAMRRAGGTWVAWGDGDADATVVDENDCIPVPPEEEAYTLRRLWLTDDQLDDYYYGFSNRVLWPLCHAALATVEPCGDTWDAYREVNETFADAVADAAGDGGLAWLQDYHLALAPGLVGERASGDPFLAHAWHIPWPAWDTFRACPHAADIVRGLLGNDLIVFHVPRYCENFLETADAALPAADVDVGDGRVSVRGETTVVRSVPMGVPADTIARQAESMRATGYRAAFRRNRGIDPDTRLAIGVDRLDYTKGIPERLAALERLFEDHPRWRGELTYVQVGTESRSAISAYARYQDDVEAAVARVNDRFGTDDWQPVVYTTEMIPDDALAGLYREADLAVVSPVRDGMNLVAQEYVAASEDGVLVLSDQAGVHDELGEYAVTVRPHDTAGFADALHDALTMPAPERRHRFDALSTHVHEHDIDSWLRSILGTVESLQADEPVAALED